MSLSASLLCRILVSGYILDFMFDFPYVPNLNLFVLGYIQSLVLSKELLLLITLQINHQKGVNVSGGPPISLCM